MIALDHVQLVAPPGCERAAREFYGGLLGLRELPKPAELGREGCWFECGATQIHVGVAAEFAPWKKAHLGFALPSVSELERIRAALVERGLPVRVGNQVAGSRRFHAEDPFGNRLEFLAPIS